MARVSLSTYGTSFATRGRGEELRERILTDVDTVDPLVIDLDGVKHVSYSFADELLAKLSTDAGITIEIVGASPSVQRTVDEAVRRRSAIPSAC
jgi:anti-anti-sigma regulatory factor